MTNPWFLIGWGLIYSFIAVAALMVLMALLFFLAKCLDLVVKWGFVIALFLLGFWRLWIWQQDVLEGNYLTQNFWWAMLACAPVSWWVFFHFLYDQESDYV